jgi:hypothetical protein
MWILIHMLVQAARRKTREVNNAVISKQYLNKSRAPYCKNRGNITRQIMTANSVLTQKATNQTKQLTGRKQQIGTSKNVTISLKIRRPNVPDRRRIF